MPTHDTPIPEVSLHAVRLSTDELRGLAEADPQLLQDEVAILISGSRPVLSVIAEIVRRFNCTP